MGSSLQLVRKRVTLGFCPHVDFASVKFQISDQVKIRPVYDVPGKMHLQFGEVIGVNGSKHCADGDMYMVEFCAGFIAAVCSCALMPLAGPATRVQWRHCVWQPKDMKGSA